ncbi:hypothetical protein Tco_0289878, partial [Tanacetum coccineum]
MASGGSDRDAQDALSKLLQMGTVAEYERQADHHNHRQPKRPQHSNTGPSVGGNVGQGRNSSDNNAQDQASEVEMKVLVDGKQDDIKVVKVMGVAVEQNNDKPNMLE